MPLLVVLPDLPVQEVEPEVQVDEAVEGEGHVDGPEVVLRAGEVQLLHADTLSFRGDLNVVLDSRNVPGDLHTPAKHRVGHREGDLELSTREVAGALARHVPSTELSLVEVPRDCALIGWNHHVAHVSSPMS